MAGARSRSRSTTVAAAVAPGNHKRKRTGQKRRSRDQPPVVTWDHDNSDSEELNSATATASTTATGKKRPRESIDKKPATVQRDNDKGDKSVKRKPRGKAARSSGDTEDEEASDGDHSALSEEEVERANDRHGAGVEAPAVGSTGGMGDVMAKILNQKLGTKTQAPVLAKRKTKAMKEMELESVKRVEARGQSAVRRANMTQQFVIPDHTTTDYERQLKKIATRGVVALFNAISKRQTENAPGGSSSAGTGSGSAGTAKSASRHAFLDMLKTGVKPAAGPAEVGGKTSGGVGLARGAGWNKGEGGEVEGGSWSVLKEDYMMGASSMKNWDQESADSEQDALGGPGAMSDDDSD